MLASHRTTTCFLVLTQNCSPVALIQGRRVLTEGMILYNLVGHNFHTTNFRLSGLQLLWLVSKPLPLARHGSRVYFLDLGNSGSACSKRVECVTDGVRRLGAGHLDRDRD